MSTWVALCRWDELVDGQSRGFDPMQRGNDSLFVIRQGEQAWVYRNSCPHLDVPLQYRKDRYLSADGCAIVCYAHGARFLLESGLCTYGPCLGERLAALPWRRVEGWIEVQISRQG